MGRRRGRNRKRETVELSSVHTVLDKPFFYGLSHSIESGDQIRTSWAVDILLWPQIHEFVRPGHSNSGATTTRSQMRCL